MKRKALVKSVLCLILALSVVLCMSGCKGKDDTTDTTDTTEKTTVTPVYYTNSPGTVQKSETVYVSMDNSGKVSDITVTDWLHTDNAEVAVKDVSSLKNIQNVKSDIQPVTDKGGLTWHMNTTDLYYSGKSTKELPVTISVEYYLDGKEIKPDKLAGKSGKVEIRISMKNNICKTEKIEGKNVKVYSPIVVVGGMILSESRFQNLSMTNGKLVGDGSKQIAMLVSFPGMNETLGLDKLNVEDLSFASEFTLTADANDFSLGNMYFAAIPVSMLGSDIKMPESMNELQTSLGQLKDLESAISTIDPNKILSTLLTDPNKISELTGMINEAVELYENNKVLFEVLPKYMTQENLDKFKKLFDSIDPDEIKAVVELINNPLIQSFFKDLPQLAENMNEVMPLLEELSKDMSDPEVAKAIENLPQTVEQLSKIQGTIEENRELIDALTELMSDDNIDKLESLLQTLRSGNYAGKLKEYGILAEDADALISRLSAMLEYGSEYDIYTEKAPGMTSNVMFVYQTPPIEQKVQQEESTAQTTEELPWYKKIFSKD